MTNFLLAIIAIIMLAMFAGCVAVFGADDRPSAKPGCAAYDKSYYRNKCLRGELISY